MVNFSGLLNRKYDLQQQDANTRALAERNRADIGFQDVNQRGIAVRADANLANTRAALLPQEQASANALRAAQAAALTESTRNAVTDFNDPFGMRQAEIGLRRDQGNYYGAQAADIAPRPPAPGSVGVGGTFGRGATTLDQVIADRQRRGMPPLSSGMLQGPDEILDVTPRRPRLGFAKGTARVPGKGSGKVDTVPAKLAPGEAVLNKAAADKMGRGAIARLNKAGARKMGMV
jgi:hypothetical protein